MIMMRMMVMTLVKMMAMIDGDDDDLNEEVIDGDD